jgi:hypothetical protein
MWKEVHPAANFSMLFGVPIRKSQASIPPEGEGVPHFGRSGGLAPPGAGCKPFSHLGSSEDPKLKGSPRSGPKPLQLVLYFKPCSAGPVQIASSCTRPDPSTILCSKCLDTRSPFQYTQNTKERISIGIRKHGERIRFGALQGRIPIKLPLGISRLISDFPGKK